jgi:hypothetical protein
MALEDEVLKLDKKTKKQVKETLQSIEIALKLNSGKMKAKKVPPELKKLTLWKQELEQWDKRYGEAEDLIEKAEGLGAFQEICAKLG